MALSSRSFGSMVKRTPASPLLLMPRALVSHFVDTTKTLDRAFKRYGTIRTSLRSPCTDQGNPVCTRD
ncbi:hypothetical protein HanPSC8_Chr04g0179991 [Helianthus annuus]|nr:hypothetical protein HanPSC8_Chr04g0179991 [Helianthus annuus]